MAINERVITGTTAEAGNGAAADAEQGLILHLDANDVDSYDGDGSIWYDISEHDVTIPISDNSSNLKCHLNFSDSTSYGGTGTTVTDISDESNDFTFVGATASDFDKDNGGYLDLDNSGDYLERSSTTSGHFDGDYTLELWLNPHENNNFTYFYCKQSASTNGLLIGNFGGSTGQLEVYRYTTSGSSSSDTFTGSGITANQWNHVTIVFSGSKGFLYVNGEQKDSSTSFSGTYPANFTNIRIGGGYSTAFDTNGELGVFRLYDKALSASEIGQNYRHGRDYIYTDLIDDTDLELHLDPTSYSGSGTTWTADLGNNGTISGATYDQELGDWFSFDGSGDIVTSAGNISTTDRDFTVEFWTRPDSTSTSQNFFEVEDTSGNRKISMVVNTGSKFRCYIYRAADSNSSNTITSATSFTTGRWYHIAVVFKQGVSSKIYIDGELEATSTTNVTDNRPQTYGDTKLGDGAFGDLNGAIGQYRFYSSDLSADEVMQNFNFTKNDYPNGNDLTLYNSPTFEPTSPNYLRFDSANDEARLSSVNIPIDGGFTFSVYIRRHTSVSGYHQMLRLTGTGYTSYLFLIAGQNNTQYFSANSGTGNSLSTYGDGRTWTNNQWIHVLYTKENGNGSSNRGELYINGTSIKTATNLSNNTDITNIYINRDASFPTTRNAQCDVGYMKLYDKSFTDDEALAEFNATKDDYGL